MLQFFILETIGKGEIFTKAKKPPEIGPFTAITTILQRIRNTKNEKKLKHNFWLDFSHYSKPLPAKQPKWPLLFLFCFFLHAEWEVVSIVCQGWWVEPIYTTTKIIVFFPSCFPMVFVQRD
jgi:hypothetical protein